MIMVTGRTHVTIYSPACLPCQAYRAALSFTDRNIGVVLGGLESAGFGESTIIALWSDHVSAAAHAAPRVVVCGAATLAGLHHQAAASSVT